jgi:hypothetical protein
MTYQPGHPRIAFLQRVVQPDTYRVSIDVGLEDGTPRRTLPSFPVSPQYRTGTPGRRSCYWETLRPVDPPRVVQHRVERQVSAESLYELSRIFTATQINENSIQTRSVTGTFAHIDVQQNHYIVLRMCRMLHTVQFDNLYNVYVLLTKSCCRSTA